MQDLLGKQVDDAPLQAVCQSNLISLQCSSGSLHQKKWLSAAIKKLEAYLDKVSSAVVRLRCWLWRFVALNFFLLDRNTGKTGCTGGRWAAALSGGHQKVGGADSDV